MARVIGFHYSPVIWNHLGIPPFNDNSIRQIQMYGITCIIEHKYTTYKIMTKVKW